MKSERSVLPLLLRILAALVWAGLILFAVLHRQEFTPERILSYTPRRPLLAAAALLLFFALKSLTVVFYSGVLYAAGGLLFPLPAALAVNACGTLVMALLPYCLARGLGARRAESLRAKYPGLVRLERMRNRNSFAFVVALRCINIVNFDVGSMYCGAVRLALPPFLTGSLLGKAVDIVLITIMGANLGGPRSAPFLIALGLDLCIALAVLLWSRQREKAEEAPQP